jgi:hypothetical protein
MFGYPENFGDAPFFEFIESEEERAEKIRWIVDYFIILMIWRLRLKMIDAKEHVNN